MQQASNSTHLVQLEIKGAPHGDNGDEASVGHFPQTDLILAAPIRSFDVVHLIPSMAQCLALPAALAPAPVAAVEPAALADIETYNTYIKTNEKDGKRTENVPTTFMFHQNS